MLTTSLVNGTNRHAKMFRYNRWSLAVAYLIHHRATALTERSLTAKYWNSVLATSLINGPLTYPEFASDGSGKCATTYRLGY